MIPEERAPLIFEGVTLRRRRWSLPRTGLLLTLASGAAAVLLIAVYRVLPAHDGSLETASLLLRTAGTWFALMADLFVIFTLVSLIVMLVARRRPGTLAIAEAGIVLSSGTREQILPHEQLTAAHLDHATHEIVFHVAGGDRIHIAGATRPEQVEAMLTAIASGATERALELSIQRRVGFLRMLAGIGLMPALALLLFVASFFDSVVVVVLLALVFGVVWFYFLSRAGMPRLLVVGHDGIALEGGKQTLYFPYAEIERVEPSLDGIELTLDDDTTIPIALFPSEIDWVRDLARRRRDLLLQKIRAALELSRQVAEDPLGSAQLERAGRSVQAWRAALRELMRKPLGYRAAAIDPDHLTHVLWTPKLEPERRLGAALALLESEDPTLRRRVRVFIDTSAGDALREALEKAAEDELDDESLGKILARRVN